MIKPDFVNVGSAKLAYKTFGTGKVNIIVESSLNSCIGEWWHLAERLSENYTILLYERAGYGLSSKSSLERTPKNIANELHKLISLIEHEEKMVFIGHSQGGLYIQQYARLYPETVRGVILVDPLSANDNVWKELLTPEEYKKSGADKFKNFRTAYILTKIGLGFILKPLIKMSPPFYYYKDFSKEALEYMLSALTKPLQYKSAINEYELAHHPNEIESLKNKDGFPEVPLILITHSSELSMKETMDFGGASREVAEKVEKLWQDLMKEYLTFSPNSTFIQARNSSHYVHLTEFELIEKALTIIG